MRGSEGAVGEFKSATQTREVIFLHTDNEVLDDFAKIYNYPNFSEDSTTPGRGSRRIEDNYASPRRNRGFA